MKEKLVKRKIITYGDEFLAEMELSYYLTENETKKPHEKRFGVRIIKETIENGARISEDNSGNNIFSYYEEARAFLDMLIKYEVTPIAFESIISDCFSDFITPKSIA